MKKAITQYCRWANSLTWWQIAQWSLALIGSGAIAFYSPILAAIYYILIVIAMVFAIRRGYKGIIIGLMIGSLLFSTSPQTSSAQEARPPAVAQCNAVVIGALVVAVGGFIIYKLVTFCKKAFPPPPPPPPPPPTPAPTNAPPAITSFAPQAIVINLSTPEQTSGQDISRQGWMDHTQSNNPVPFQDYIHLTMSNSVDMKSWTSLYSIGIWLSSNSVETVIYDGKGNPTFTNWCPGNPYTTSLTNSLPFKVYDPAKPNQYFKYAQ